MAMRSMLTQRVSRFSEGSTRRSGPSRAVSGCPSKTHPNGTPLRQVGKWTYRATERGATTAASEAPTPIPGYR